MPTLINDSGLQPLRTFQFHGVELSPTGGGTQHLGECPFCGKHKFYVEEQEGRWECKTCGLSGNPLTFLRQLHEAGTTRGLEELATERGLLDVDTLIQWGVVRSPLTGEYLVPGYNVDGEVHNLYRFVKWKDGTSGEWRQKLMPTPGVHEDGWAHGLHGVPLLDKGRSASHICEGVWDGMAWWEIMGNEINVLAVPGDHVFRKVWAGVLAGNDVTLLYDSDHPRTVQIPGGGERVVSPSGTLGMRKATTVLLTAEKPPRSISYLAWGISDNNEAEEGPGYHPELPSGTDIRDVLTDYGDTKGKRVGGAAWILEQVRLVPDSWKEEARKVYEPKKTVDLRPSHCTSWEDLLDAWGRKTNRPLRLRTTMVDVLATMLGVAVSTEQTGDQLFLQVVAEPGSAKSVFADAMIVSKKRCFGLEHLTGFNSGYRDKSGKDFSLIARINRKCLVTPEGDVLMNSPQFDDIMAQQRRIFDGVSSKSYKTMDEDKRYEGLRTPWVMCITPAMLWKSQAQLGDRFLRVWIDPPSAKEKQDILLSVARSAWDAVDVTSNGSAESSLAPGLANARQKTAGYLEYLMDGLASKLARVKADVEQVFAKCSLLGDFVADFRARPDMDIRKDSEAMKEIPTRLTHQFIRLSKCLAVVLGREWVDEEILRIVKKVAVDTARGRTLNIARHLYEVGEIGCDPRALSVHVRDLGDEERVKRWLYFMRRVDIVIPFSQESVTGIRLKNTPTRWKLSPRARNLYRIVMEEG